MSKLSISIPDILSIVSTMIAALRTKSNKIFTTILVESIFHNYYKTIWILCVLKDTFYIRKSQKFRFFTWPNLPTNFCEWNCYYTTYMEYLTHNSFISNRLLSRWKGYFICLAFSKQNKLSEFMFAHKLII